MVTRFTVLLGLSLAIAAGALVLVEFGTPRQAPVAPARQPAATVGSNVPAAPAAQPQVLVVTTSPAQTQTPVVTAPLAQAPAPVVTAPPAEAPKPVDTAPPAQAPKPVVTTPPAQTPKPVVTAPPAEAPKPVVTAPPAQPATPVVTAPATPAPAPVVAAPPAETPAATVVNPPLPIKRPVISEMTIPAKALFSRVKLPSTGPSRAIGYYPRGCLQGGVELPIDGKTWEVMRVVRNRNWGHPELIKFLERFAPLAAKATGWHGILIGDMAQPRGGPLPFGHLSHQIGLDVDIWFMPMPGHRLSLQERNSISATSLVASDRKHLNPKTWTPADAAFIRTAAEQPEVERVLVNAAIKKELCRLDGKHHNAWLDKVRPWYGHDDHIHVRLKCPADSPHCRHQPAVPDSAGCGKSLDYWFSDRVLHPKPSPKPAKPRKAITLADLPAACKMVLDAPAKHTDLTAIER